MIRDEVEFNNMTMWEDLPEGKLIEVHECWIKPELDLNVDFGCYHGQPLGDTAELMPLDNS